MTDKGDEQILNKIERYCAFQERCWQEVSMKLQQLGVTDESEKEKIMEKLEKKRFVDEARYARAFAKDKFNLHQWGKIKIRHALHQKSISQNLIDNALGEIDYSEYTQVLNSLLKKKADELKHLTDPFIQKNKIANFLEGKGYEPELIWNLIGRNKSVL